MRGRTEATNRVFKIGSKLIAKGMLALALGGLAPNAVFAQAAKDDYVYLKQSVFAIPIQVAPDRLNDIKELRLFVSSDRGRSWRMMQTARPTQKMFTFQAPNDGEYWFTLAYVDKSDNVEPTDVREEPPGLKVILDTKAPTLDLQAMPRSDSQATVTWRAADDQLDMSSLKLEYQQNGETTWSELKTPKTANGRRDWIVEPSKSYTVRASVKDRSGNTSSTKVEIPRGTTQVASARPQTPPDFGGSRNFDIPPPPSMTPAANPGTERVAADQPTPRTAEPNWMAAKPTPAAPNYVQSTVPNFAPAATPIPAVAKGNVFDRSRPDLPADARRTSIPQAGTQTSTGPSMEDRNQFLAMTANKTPIASSNRPPIRETGIVQASATEPVKPAPKKIPLIGSTRFAVNYDVKGVGPAGIGKVELFYTEDNGQNWKSAGEDPKKMGSFEVEMPHEGRYGLKIVVTSPAGFGQKPPIKGEAPAMVVEVDTTAPVAELFQPVPDTNGANDTMVISWTARDTHIAGSPVSLYFSEVEGGPYYAIKTNLPAVGQYSWKVPEGLPPQVYLRLIARDLCDNVSTADTAKPIVIDLSRPSGEILDIATVPEKSSIR